MRAPASAYFVPEARLRLSQAPTAELAEAAIRAQRDADLEAADFIVVAVQPGGGERVRAAVEGAARAARAAVPDAA